MGFTVIEWIFWAEVIAIYLLIWKVACYQQRIHELKVKLSISDKEGK